MIWPLGMIDLSIGLGAGALYDPSAQSAMMPFSSCEPESCMVYLVVDVLPETSKRKVEAVNHLLKTSSSLDPVVKGYYGS